MNACCHGHSSNRGFALAVENHESKETHQALPPLTRVCHICLGTMPSVQLRAASSGHWHYWVLSLELGRMLLINSELLGFTLLGCRLSTEGCLGGRETLDEHTARPDAVG